MSRSYLAMGAYLIHETKVGSVSPLANVGPVGAKAAHVQNAIAVSPMEQLIFLTLSADTELTVTPSGEMSPKPVRESGDFTVSAVCGASSRPPTPVIFSDYAQ